MLMNGADEALQVADLQGENLKKHFTLAELRTLPI